jgi:aspartate aminotransferase-like enzyme
MIPGPTNLPPEVREALSRPSIYHRGPEFAELLATCTAGLKDVFQTSADVLILCSSSTGGVEASIVNFLSPGDRVLVVVGGKFGERMAQIAAAFGAEVEVLEVEYGRAVDPDQVRARLDGHQALLFVQNETSTGVRQDADLLAEAARERDALTIVDAVSSMGGMPIYTDRWGLDAVAAGSQKALMLPPGLAFVSASERAWQAAESARMPKFYFDLAAARAALAKGQTPWTPNVNMLRGLQAALRLIQAEGLAQVWRRHHALAEATRAAMEALGLSLLPDREHASDVVTAVRAPADLDSTALVKQVRERHGILISGGQGTLRGRIFRIGHLGCCQLSDVLRTVEAVARELKALGWARDVAGALEAARNSYQAAWQAWQPSAETFGGLRQP